MNGILGGKNKPVIASDVLSWSFFPTRRNRKTYFIYIYSIFEKIHFHLDNSLTCHFSSLNHAFRLLLRLYEIVQTQFQSVQNFIRKSYHSDFHICILSPAISEFIFFKNGNTFCWKNLWIIYQLSNVYLIFFLPFFQRFLYCCNTEITFF